MIIIYKLVNYFSITATALLLTTGLFAQEDEAEIIEVQGAAEYAREIDRYEVEMMISTNSYYSYDESDKPSIESLTKLFFEHMEKNGFEEERFKLSNKPKYYTAAQAGGEISYIFETTSIAELDKLVGTKKLNGVYVSGGQTFYKPLNDPSAVVAAALEDAKKNATVVAKAMGKSLGKIVQVSDQSRYYVAETEAYYEGEEKKAKYYILVKFLTQR